MMKLVGSVAFVTGAAGGIGRHLVAGLLERGAARVYAADLALPREPRSSDARMVAMALDVADHAEVARAAVAAADVSILVNNAGVNLRSAFIRAPDLVAARREMEVNYFGTLAMCRAFAPLLCRNGGGAIVNVLSILAKVTIPALGSYCASKAALLRLSEGVRAELAAQHTHVLAAMPWAVDTPMSGPFPGSKSSAHEVAHGILDALEAGQEEVYFHEVSREIMDGLASDPKAVERRFSTWLPK
jgi:NAD(P)-dependent dehydrogenase (short-subunit alcohol dehydrogenase family)